jgi:hypothetical protein
MHNEILVLFDDGLLFFFSNCMMEDSLNKEQIQPT